MAFKTKICVLYKKGHCNRQNCSFAHGDAELRRYNTSPSSFNGRRDYRGTDLREKLGRQLSPPGRRSLDRDTLPSHGQSSQRFGKKSDWSQRKRRHFDGESNFSGSLRFSDGNEGQARERKSPSSEFKDVHDDQYKQIQSEIDMLEDHKQKLQIYMEEGVQEANSLNSKIEELEMQLSAEKEECRRISTKLRKFVKTCNRHTRIQEELKRSQARLERLGDQLGSDAKAAANEDDTSINVLSDEEPLGDLLRSPKIDKVSPKKDEILDSRLMGQRKDQYTASQSKKRMRVHIGEADEKSKKARSATREGLSLGNMRSERHSRLDPYIVQTKTTDEIRADANGISNSRPFVNNSKPMRRKSNYKSVPLVEKFKDLKSTGIAANMMDEEVEVVELNEKLEARKISFAKIEEGSTYDDTFLPISVLPPPPPPPVAGNAYIQYKGNNETVDVVIDDGDEHDKDNEMLDVDIV